MAAEPEQGPYSENVDYKKKKSNRILDCSRCVALCAVVLTGSRRRCEMNRVWNSFVPGLKVIPRSPALLLGHIGCFV